MTSLKTGPMTQAQQGTANIDAYQRGAQEAYERADREVERLAAEDADRQREEADAQRAWRQEYNLKNAELPEWNNSTTTPDVMVNKTFFSLRFPLRASTVDRNEFFKRRSTRLHVSCQAEAVHVRLSSERQEYEANYRDGNDYDGLL